jgi:phosphoserine aminotransferase
MTPDKDPIKLAIEIIEDVRKGCSFGEQVRLLEAIEALQTRAPAAPAVTDLDALKREATEIFSGRVFKTGPVYVQYVVSDIIDHLAATGRIAGVERCREGGE